MREWFIDNPDGGLEVLDCSTKDLATSQLYKISVDGYKIDLLSDDDAVVGSAFIYDSTGDYDDELMGSLMESAMLHTKAVRFVCPEWDALDFDPSNN